MVDIDIEEEIKLVSVGFAILMAVAFLIGYFQGLA